MFKNRVQTVKTYDFSTGEYKYSGKQEKRRMGQLQANKDVLKKAGTLTAASILVSKAPLAFAAAPVNAMPEAIPVGVVGDAGAAAGSAIAQSTLNALSHALDPLLDLVISLSFPICSIIIVGSFFYLAFGNSEKCWSGVMRGSLSFILIQLSPILLGILKTIGNAL